MEMTYNDIEKAAEEGKKILMYYIMRKIKDNGTCEYLLGGCLCDLNLTGICSFESRASKSYIHGNKVKRRNYCGLTNEDIQNINIASGIGD
jgi:hypothetical protein